MLQAPNHPQISAAATPAERPWLRPTQPGALAWLALAAAAWLLGWVSPAQAAWALPLLVAPVLEEAVLRSGVQRGLRLRGVSAPVALLLCALLFALAHVATRGASLLSLATVLPGAWIGWVHERSRRLAPCVAWHAGFNALWLGFALLN